jgi:heme/copper-type cytochrome/quinol oxidase subunit 2
MSLQKIPHFEDWLYLLFLVMAVVCTPVIGLLIGATFWFLVETPKGKSQCKTLMVVSSILLVIFLFILILVSLEPGNPGGRMAPVYP